jgi:uncharacterized Tic20 family protein
LDTIHTGGDAGGMAEAPPPADQVPADARTWGMMAHLSALSGYVFPLGWVLGPLIVFAVKKDQYPSVRENALEAMNFNITCFIAAVLCIPLIFVCVGAFVLPAIAVAQVVLAIIAGIKAGDGSVYHYPWTIRFLR